MSNSEDIKSFSPRGLPRSSDEKLNKEATGLMTSSSCLKRLFKKENFDCNFQLQTCHKEFLVLFLGFCSGTEPGSLRGRGGFLESGYFDKRFVHSIQKKGIAGETFGYFFSKILSKMHFKWEFKPYDAHKQRTFLQIQGTFFAKPGHFSSICKKGHGTPLPPLVAPLLFYFF